jgi:hypothetical protein
MADPPPSPSQDRMGYGNDSRQNGPSSSRNLHMASEAEFAFSLITRTRQVSG